MPHRAMDGSFHCTLAQNFCNQSPRCTNPNQCQIHFRYLSKNLCPSRLSKKVCKEHNKVYNTDTVDQPENTAFTSSPVLSEKFSLHRKISYDHQMLFEKKILFRIRIAAQNLAPVGLSSLNRLKYSLTPRINKGCVLLRNLGVRSIGNPFSKSRSF